MMLRKVHNCIIYVYSLEDDDTHIPNLAMYIPNVIAFLFCLVIIVFLIN